MDQYIGKLLDNRYEILERIGSGGMAVVYKARCHRLNRLVAIKVLKTDLAQDEEFRRRFHDESQAVAMLSHPNIVAVYDVSHSDDLDYIVMELIDGITLKQYMQKKGAPLNWREALHFITQIMRGLSHAHSRGIIHRDIKPHNIMILRDGSVKVADFGIARLTSAAQNTLTQEALGSVHYISPEQARGSHIDARSDIYSAGVVLYEMITGRLPYEGDSPSSVAIQHINSVPLAPREINPEIPEALEAIAMKAMAANVEQRYVSADAMLEDLEEFRKNPNINFEYTAADLLGGQDEPTQVMGSGDYLRAGGSLSASRGGEHHRGAREEHDAQRERERSVERRRREWDEEEYEMVSRRRERGSPVPTILAVLAILVFLGVIGYFLWVSFLGPLLNPTVVQYETPNLVGKVYEEVVSDAALLNGFTLERYTEEDETVPEGEIIRQDPAAGTMKLAGDRTIVVTVSGGSSHFVMSDYTNQSAAHVKALLEDRGFLVVEKEEVSETITKDYIISHEPGEGAKLNEGDSVTLVVSAGPEKKMVPMVSFVGQPIEAVREGMERLGLTVGGTTEVYDETQPEGYVVWQSVEPYTEVAERSLVDFKISKGPDPAAQTPEPSDEPTDSPEPSDEPTGSPEPSDEPTGSPNPSEPQPPEPTPSEPQPPEPQVSRQIEVTLPSDRASVELRITVGGEEQFYEAALDTSFRFIRPILKGAGSGVEVCIYMDGVLVDTQYVDFVDG